MRKRSRYRARPVIADPLTMMRPASPARRNEIMDRFFSALEAMARNTHPGEDEWRDLSDAINTVETLTLHQGKLVPFEVMPTVQAAIEAMVGAARRHQAGQRKGLSGPGLQALRDVLAIYQTCLEGLTAFEMAQAQTETQHRVNAILRSRKSDSQVVML